MESFESSERIDAVILAGGPANVIDPTLRYKGLVPIGGRPMVAYVIDALCAATTINRVFVTVPDAEDVGTWSQQVDKVIVTDGDFIDNVLAGIACCDQERPLLICTGDIPAITAEAIDDYVTRALALEVDFAYPLISRETIETQCPGSSRTYFNLAEGCFTGGNVVVTNPAAFIAAREVAQVLFNLRKNPLKIAKYASPFFVVKLARGRLTIAEAEKKACQIVGGTARVVISSYAAIGTDVDKPVDIESVEYILESNNEALMSDLSLQSN